MTPLDQLNACIDAAIDGPTFLFNHAAPKPDTLTPHDRVRIADDLLPCFLTMTDVTLRDLLLDQLASHIGLKPKQIKDRLRSAQAAPTNPAGQGDVGGEEKDGGFHRALVGSLKRFLQRLDLYPDAVNGWLNAAGRPIGAKTRDLVNDFHFAHASYFESLPRDRIDITLAGITREARAKRRADILAAVTGKPSTRAGLDELRKWLKATTGRDDSVDLAVMLHFMWQVKRLNTGKPVAWDIMPILVGKQGDGKSTAIELLCAIWQELLVNINAQTLVDERSTEVLGDYAIGFWGEMSGGSKAEVQALKNTLTSKRKSYRELGGHHHNSVVRRMAFIGDSNNPVKDVIADPTGMRRFYEVQVNGLTDRATLNAIDYALAWQAVSEDDAAPFDDVALQVRERQKDLIVQDAFDNFLAWGDDRNWDSLTILEEGRPYQESGGAPVTTIPKYDPARGYSLSQVAILYKHYVRLVGGVVRDSAWVGRRLGEASWIKDRSRRDGGKRTPHWFKPEAPADPELAASLAARAGKMATTPSKQEDAFNREPGDDTHEEGHYRGGDDAPMST